MAYRYTVGLDPDSKKHGIAIFEHVELIELVMIDTPALINWILSIRKETSPSMLFSIEHSDGNQFIYNRNVKDKPQIQSKIAMGVGKNQQAQIEVCRWLDFLKIDYLLHKPAQENWATNRRFFEKMTGWDRRSNVDTRSAAYFGYIALGTPERAVKPRQKGLGL